MTTGTAFGPGVDDVADEPPKTQQPAARKRRNETKPLVDASNTQSTDAVPAPKRIVIEEDCILDLVLGNMMTLHVGQRVTDPQIIALVLERKLPYREV